MITSERCQLFYQYIQNKADMKNYYSTLVWSQTLERWSESKHTDRYNDVQDCVYFWELWSDFTLSNIISIEKSMNEFSDVVHQVGDGVFGKNKSFFKTPLGRTYLKLNNPPLLRDILIEEILEND
jgi:hypothetical protein